jgi:hypothetical protein
VYLRGRQKQGKGKTNDELSTGKTKGKRNEKKGERETKGTREKKGRNPISSVIPQLRKKC